ncbi:putative ATP-dependent RNA helicase TDRD12 isoform X1 [Dermacentor variabilis]|uniref:putative ATP-dependent RNA helicase TDRD12 isoform X1 n=1 Tax=Dermacentor variabilis TaxID=34621 RepID=UPI003F5B55D7
MAIEAFKNAQGWKQRMNVIVLKVTSPTSFLVREAVGAEMSQCGREFISMEASMKQYMKKWDIQPVTPLLPEIDSIVLVRNPSDRGWYRGHVSKIFDTLTGYKVEVFLVDYGETLMVDRKALRKVPNERILEVPFQCVEFSILGLKPVRWTIDPTTITMKFVEGSSWDTASIEYVKSTVGKADAVHVQVLGKTTSGGLYGKLFIDCNKNVISLDEELVKLNYAFLDAEASYQDVILDNGRPDKIDQLSAEGSQNEGISENARLWQDILSKSASAALKDVLDSVYDTSSSIARIPVEVCAAEVSPPGSLSVSGASSPAQWSSTTLSIDTSSSGTDTPPTLPGLGRGLALMLKHRELEGDSSSHKSNARDKAYVEAEELCTVMPSSSEDSDDDASYTPTLVGTPPGVFREGETFCSPDSPGSLSSVPLMPHLVSVGSKLEPSCKTSEPVVPPSLSGGSQFGETKARGRARLLCLSSSPSSTSSPFEQNRMSLPRDVDSSFNTKMYAPHTLTEKCAVSIEAPFTNESVASEVCAADVKSLTPLAGLPDLSAYRSLGRGHALLAKLASSHTPGQHIDSLSSQSLSSQQNSLAQHCPYMPSDSSQPRPTSHIGDNYASEVVTKASQLKDLLEKKGRSLYAPPLQGCPSNSQGHSLTNSPTPDATTGTMALKKDVFAGSSVSCPGSSSNQIPSATMSSRETFLKLIATSNFEVPCEPVKGLDDCSTTMDGCHSSEDFRSPDFKSFPELPSDMDPSGRFKGAIYFNTDYDSCRLSSQPAISKVRALCHGIRLPRPMTHLDQAPFDGSVKSRLCSKGFRAPSCIQSVVWPAVMSGRDVVAVAPPHSGKTLAYLIPLVSRLTEETDYESLPAGVGPLMVVLTSTWKGAARLSEQAKLLIHEKRGPKVCVLYAGGAEKGKEIELVNGCDILVATPQCFLRFLTNYDRLIVNLRRCCHLVLDDGEKLLDKFAIEVTSVMNEFRRCTEQRRPGMLRGQIVVCSTMWSTGLNWFIRMTYLSKTPLVMITSFYEAAIYAQVPTIACFGDPHSRHEILLRIVEGNHNRKVVVCTADRQSAIDVHQLLLSCSVYCLLLHDELTMAEIWEVTNEWATERPKTKMPVLVAQDNVLPLANIRDAGVLIHYDVPELSKYNFGFRFSCLADRMRSFNDKDPVSTTDEPVAHMILSSNNRSLSVQLVEFLNRLGTNVPDGLMRLSSEEQTKASKNARLALCPNLKAFGHCERKTAEKRCSYRHQIIREADHSPAWTDLPSQGQVLIVVTKVVNASRFYAWILQHWDASPSSTNESKSKVKENLELQNAMVFLNEYLSQPSNCKSMVEKAIPKVGEVYGLEHSYGHFRRVLVTSVVPNSSAPASVTVSYMDYGGQSTVAATRLLHLPSTLTKLRPLAVEVYCCRVQPQDHDLDWTFQAVFKSHELVFRKELLGKIVLRLGNTLWLDPLVLWEDLPFVDAKVPLKNVRATLIEERLACDNATHVESLCKLAADAGVALPLFPEEKREMNDNDSQNAVINQHCTTFLDTKDFNHVYLWKVTSPSHFYVQPLKFNSCLDELEDNIQKAVKKMELVKLKSVHLGAVCIARYDNNRWYRGEVQKVLNNAEVIVFFPDYGDTAKCPPDELLEPVSWMMLLPYQGVQCSLAGIIPPSGKWTPMAVSMLENFGYDDNDVNRLLCLRVVKKNAGERPGTSNYEVLLFSSCHKGRISVANLLVEEKLATLTELPKLSFDVNLPHATVFLEQWTGTHDSETDEDGEEVTLECQRKLEKHVYDVFSEVRDQVLAPAAAELLQELICDSGTLGQGDTSYQPQARGAEAPELCKQGDKKAAAKVKTAKVHSRASTRNLPPLLESQFKTEHSHQASISWWQDHSFVYVDIMIANVKEHELTVTAAIFRIRIKTVEHEYLAHERLYAAIVPGKTRLVQKADSLRITFEKVHAKHSWKFLTRNKRKVQYIRYQLDHIDVSDNEDDIVSACKVYKDPLFTENWFENCLCAAVGYETKTMFITTYYRIQPSQRHRLCHLKMAAEPVFALQDSNNALL